VKKQSILLVEADILARHPLAEYLRDCGYIVLEAANTGEAQHLAEHANFDAALIDAASVGEDGFTLAQWLRQTRPSVAISLTGNIDKVADQARKLCDEAPSLTKPLDHRAVLDHIKRILAARERVGNED